MFRRFLFRLWHWLFEDRRNFKHRVLQLLHELKEIAMATQQEVDDLTTEVGTIKPVLAKIDADVEFLKSLAQNPAITLDALKAAVADLKTSAQMIDDKTPDQP